MESEDHELFCKDEVFKVISCALEVINGLGHGLHEKPYENALAIEFTARQIPFDQQKSFPVLYKDQKIATYVPDLIAFDSVIIDTKVIPRITDHERGQMINYLRITGVKVGLIINFSKRRLEWERLVN